MYGIHFLMIECMLASSVNMVKSRIDSYLIKEDYNKNSMSRLSIS